jgi:outer membrane autotransporter protein
MANSTLKLNTCLNDANPPLSDVLNLTGGGGITGAVTLVIANASGCAGGLTTGDGILLVHADSDSSSLFKDIANTVVASQGGYDYKPVLVGNDWYLQSTRSNINITGNAAAIPTLDPAHLAALTLLLLAALGWRARRQ